MHTSDYSTRVMLAVNWGTDIIHGTEERISPTDDARMSLAHWPMNDSTAQPQRRSPLIIGQTSKSEVGFYTPSLTSMVCNPPGSAEGPCLGPPPELWRDESNPGSAS